ncbi:monocarboxylate transporter 4-like [Oncorhynchus nerka]|uniref:monocarboxylate transporter 4-like n=1 Tax=Oncorhynchus nerka TaxID=8023 RepID=UPI0031B89F57
MVGESLQVGPHLPVYWSHYRLVHIYLSTRDITGWSTSTCLLESLQVGPHLPVYWSHYRLVHIYLSTGVITGWSTSTCLLETLQVGPHLPVYWSHYRLVHIYLSTGVITGWSTSTCLLESLQVGPHLPVYWSHYRLVHIYLHTGVITGWSTSTCLLESLQVGPHLPLYWSHYRLVHIYLSTGVITGWSTSTCLLESLQVGPHLPVYWSHYRLVHIYTSLLESLQVGHTHLYISVINVILYVSHFFDSPLLSPCPPGLGLALNFQPSLIMLNRYFSEKRPLANGLAAAGSPVALCCLSPLGQLLQYQYGWRGGFLILGGLLLNCCACAALMRPLVAPPKPPQREDVEKEGKELEVEKTQSKPKPLLDFSVFKDRGFLIYTIAASIMVLGLFVPPVFVVSYAKELGNEDTKSALLLSILGFIDIFARPTCGVIAGLKWVRPRVVYLFSFAMIFNGCTDLVGSQAKDYPSLVVFCVFFGISYGMVGALQFEVLMAIVGTEKFPSAIGLVLLMEAIAVLVGPPGAGRLLDATKNYMYVFLLAGIEVVLASVVLATCNFLFIRKKPSEPAAELENGTVSAEMELLNKPVAAEEEEEEEVEKGEKEVKEMKEKEEKEKEEKEKEEKDKEELKEMKEEKEKEEVKEMKEKEEMKEMKEMKEKEEVKEMKEKEEVKEMKEEAVEKAKEDEEDSEKEKEEIRPESVMVVSEEVERFLKEPEEQNGALLSSSETRL